MWTYTAFIQVFQLLTDNIRLIFLYCLFPSVVVVFIVNVVIDIIIIALMELFQWAFQCFVSLVFMVGQLIRKENTFYNERALNFNNIPENLKNNNFN
jgi:hypothetical protein